MRLLLATKNAGKLRELRQMTADSDLDWVGLAEFPDVAEVVEDGGTFLANAQKKALEYAAATGMPALADDSGLEVDALGGLPGVDSAYYAGRPRDDAANNRKLVAALAGVPLDRRSARFRCVMILAHHGDVLAQSDGCVEGLIVDQPAGDNGFGYDPHFFIPALGRRTAELPANQKNAISHRGMALRAIMAQLQRVLPVAPPEGPV